MSDEEEKQAEEKPEHETKGNTELETEQQKEPKPEKEAAAEEEGAAAADQSEFGDGLQDEELANLVTAEEYLLRKDVVLLEYEKQMFLDMVHADGLLVAAK